MTTYLEDGMTIINPANPSERAVIESDMCADRPDGDTYQPAVVMSWGGRYSGWNVYGHNIDADTVERFEDAASRLTDAVLIRWARAFYGASVVQDHGYSQGDVYMLFPIVTPEWLEEMGLDDTYTAPTDANDYDILHWAKGDAWTVSLEELQEWTNTKTGETRHDWERYDFCCGFYGTTLEAIELPF